MRHGGPPRSGEALRSVALTAANIEMAVEVDLEADTESRAGENLEGPDIAFGPKAWPINPPTKRTSKGPSGKASRRPELYKEVV